jgi:hypothetical protein
MKALVKFAFGLALLAGSTPLRAESGQTTAPEIEIVKSYWGVHGPPADPCDNCPPLSGAAQDSMWRNRPVKYVAIAELRNRSAKTIKSLDVDFVFTDPATGVEYLRYRVHSERSIGRGKKVEVRRFVRDAKKENGYTPALPDEAILSRIGNTTPRLEFARIEYADGSVWNRP